MCAEERSSSNNEKWMASAKPPLFVNVLHNYYIMILKDLLVFLGEGIVGD